MIGPSCKGQGLLFVREPKSEKNHEYGLYSQMSIETKLLASSFKTY